MKIHCLWLALVLIGLLFSSCEVKEFVLPSWDVELNVPLVNKKYFVSELIDSVNFFPVENYGIIFKTTGDIESYEVGDISLSVSGYVLSLPLISGINLNKSIPIEDTNIQIAYGIISHGVMSYRFREMASSVTSASFQFTDIKDAFGIPLSIPDTGNPGWQQLNLTGYHIGTENSNTILEEFDFSTQTNANEPNETFVGYLDIQLDDTFQLSMLRGQIDNFRIDVQDTQSLIDIEYPHGIDQAVHLTEARIDLHVNNPISFPCKLYGEFYAINEDSGEQVTKSLSYDNIYPANGNTPGETNFTLYNEVDQLLSIMPTHIDLRNAYFLIENTTEIGEIESSDEVSGDYQAYAPFRFVLYDAIITPRDSVEIEISDDNAEAIEKNVVSANLQLYVLNRLPIGAEASLYFSTNPNFDPANSLSYDIVKTAHVYACSQPFTEQMISLSLNNTEVLLFTNPRVYMRATFHFDASDGPVTINASPDDFIHLKCMMKVKTLIEER